MTEMGEPTPEAMAEFDTYCEARGITPEEAPAAFAAFLHERYGWDGTMNRVEEERFYAPAQPLRAAVKYDGTNQVEVAGVLATETSMPFYTYDDWGLRLFLGVALDQVWVPSGWWLWVYEDGSRAVRDAAPVQVLSETVAIEMRGDVAWPEVEDEKWEDIAEVERRARELGLKMKAVVVLSDGTTLTKDKE